MTQYKTYLVMFVLSAVGSFCFTPLARYVAFKWGAVDMPNARKIHKVPMPRLGGVAVFLGFCLPWAGLYLLQNPIALSFRDYERLFAALLLGSTAMFALGVYDDCRGADASKKFLIQLCVATALFVAGFRIEEITNPWGPDLKLGWFALPVTVLWIVGVTNAVNLLDGIDGLVAGVTTCMALSLAIINAMAGNILLALLTVCLAGATAGFLPRNHHPAQMFLGDSGSLTIGMVLACVGVLSLFRSETLSGAASPMITVPLILFGLPLFDTVRVMLKRLSRGVSMFQPDKNHVHHKLLALGLNQKHAAWLLYFVAASLGAASVLLSRLEPRYQLQLSILFAALAIGAYLFWKLHLQHIFEHQDRK
jgi:UDP-GlcNAc:undecaprenyl-phosphate/decaprenyl-phosphate GlcNAc-1-phosphate transferase